MSYALAWPSWGSGASSCEADSEATGYPGSNLANGRVYSRHRSVGTSVQYDLDLAAARNLDALFFAGCNFTDAATWRIRTSDDPTFVTGVYDSGTVSVYASQVATHVSPDPPWGRVALFLFPAQKNDRYVRVNVTDSGNPDGYVAAGILDVAELWIPGRSFDFGWTLSRKEVGADRHARYPRVIEHTLHTLVEAELFSVDAIQAQIGVDEEQVLVIPRTTRTDLFLREVLYAKLESLTVIQNRQQSFVTHTARLRWQEVSE